MATAAAKKAAETSMALVQYDSGNNHIALGNSVKGFIDNLSKLEDAQLVQTFDQMVNVERGMFVARGATAFEIFRRAKEAGRDFNKEKGAGVDSLMAEVAKEVGIDYTTLYADFKVFEEFGQYLTELLTTNPDAIMPREFYVLAMKTSHNAQELPFDVLQYFEERRQSTGGYFTDHARRDIKFINDGKSLDWVLKNDMKTRDEKVKNKSASKPAPAQKMIQFDVAATYENIEYGRLIVKKYGSVDKWFNRKAKEEFGDIEEQEVKPAAKKTEVKKSATKKATTAKAKPAAKGKVDTNVPGTNFKKGSAKKTATKKAQPTA